jgi:integrase
MSKQLLTQAIVDALTCAPGKRFEEHCDTQVPALLLYCTPNPLQVPRWKVRLKNASRTNETVTVGTRKDLSLAQVRKVALQRKHERAQLLKVGATAPKVEAQAMTLNAYMQEHFLPHCFAHLRSAKKYEQLHRLYIGPRFGHMPLDKITRRDAQAFHNDLLKQNLSPASADHVLKCLRAALGKAVMTFELLEKNPLKNFELFLIDNQVENYLDDEQLQRLLGVLRTDKNRTVCLILMFLLSTGARANEAMTATWKNINIESRVWTVDAVRSKSLRRRAIPLNDSSLWVLGQLDTQGKSEYLFPSPVSGKPFLAITRQWYRLCKKASIKIRIHDLRHGFASMLVSNGRSLYEVQQILGHSDPKVTMRYAHLSSKTLQEAANAGSVIVPRPQLEVA